MTRKNELKAMSESELTQRISELRKGLMRLRTQSAMKTSVENPGGIKAAKRNIARILTILTEKKLDEKGKGVGGKKEDDKGEKGKEVKEKRK